MPKLLEIGKLISTTDVRIARRLNQTVKVEEITKGRTPQWLRQTKRELEFMLDGEYFELVAA